MKICSPAVLHTVFVLTISVASQASAQAPQKTPSVVNPPPTAQDWPDLGNFPDWSGVWNPKISDQDAPVKTNPPPWNDLAAKKIEAMSAAEKAGPTRRMFS